MPTEGVLVAELSTGQKDKIVELASAFFAYLPDAPLAAKLNAIEQHFDRTWWCWIGGTDDEDPFYYRIQSPVAMMEFDHHPGVWLSNDEPAKCHIHTCVRTPNGNDYGKDLLRQHYAKMHPGKAPGI